MNIYLNEVYSKNEVCGKDEVQVTQITKDRVSYREVTGWAMGWPFVKGVEHSTTRKNFAATYPHRAPVAAV